MVKSFSQSRRRAATRRPPARRGPRDGDTERRILDAAHVVFLRRGTAGARTQEIAKEARVNSALLHYYFRTKERLAEAVFHRAAAQLLPNVIRILTSDATIETKVEQVIDLELRQLAEAPYLPGYIISELTHHPERMPQLISTVTGRAPAEVGALVKKRLSIQIADGVRAGTMQAIAPEQFVVNLVSLCIFPFAARPMVMAMLGFDQPGFDAFIDRRRKELPVFFLKALRP